MLGTARQYSHDDRDYKDLRDTLERVARAYELPVILKAHPAERLHEERLQQQNPGQAPRLVTDVRRNRELMDRASLVVSAPSTMLYHAILSATPALIVEAEPEDAPDDEFDSSPITRIPRGVTVAQPRLPEWQAASAAKTRA